MMQNKCSGVTFIELIFTLMIIALLITLLSGDLSSFFLRQKNQCTTSLLFHTLQYARSEAINRNQIVALCPSLDSVHCSLDWSKGYIVFIPQENNANSPQELLRSIRVSNPIHSGHLDIIKYSSDGRCLSRGTIHIGEGEDQHKIVLYDSGRARIEHSIFPTK